MFHCWSTFWWHWCIDVFWPFLLCLTLFCDDYSLMIHSFYCVLRYFGIHVLEIVDLIYSIFHSFWCCIVFDAFVVDDDLMLPIQLLFDAWWWCLLHYTRCSTVVIRCIHSSTGDWCHITFIRYILFLFFGDPLFCTICVFILYCSDVRLTDTYSHYSDMILFIDDVILFVVFYDWLRHWWTTLTDVNDGCPIHYSVDIYCWPDWNEKFWPIIILCVYLWLLYFFSQMSIIIDYSWHIIVSSIILIFYYYSIAFWSLIMKLSTAVSSSNDVCVLLIFYCLLIYSIQ